MDFFNNIWQWIKSLFGDINTWMINTFKFDETVTGLYEKFITPLPEWVKMVGLVGVAVLLVFGAISVIKKSMKLVIILAVIFGIIVLITSL